MNKKRLCIIVAAILVIGILTLVLPVKVPGFYYQLSYGMTGEEYYRASYEQEWNISLPSSRVVARETANAGYDGTGTVYTVLEIREEGWKCADALQSRDPVVESAFLEMVEEIRLDGKDGVTLPLPDFSQAYEWRYLEKEITGTGYNGTKATVLIHCPQEGMIYYVQSLK